MKALYRIEGTGAAPTAAGPDDAKAACPAPLPTPLIVRWLAAYVAGCDLAWRFQSELPCMTCEALRLGGVL